MLIVLLDMLKIGKYFGLFKREVEVEGTIDLWGALFSCEGNILLITHPKENLNRFFDFLRKYPFNGTVFEKHDSLEDLENILLQQKIIKDSGLVSFPYVTVFNQCLNSDKDKGAYEQAVLNKDNLSIRTITITVNCKSIPKNILQNIDTVVVYGKRRNVNKGQLEFLHSQIFKDLTNYSSFIENVVKKVEYKKAIMIKDSKIIRLCFNKDGITVTPVLLA